MKFIRKWEQFLQSYSLKHSKTVGLLASYMVYMAGQVWSLFVVFHFR